MQIDIQQQLINPVLTAVNWTQLTVVNPNKLEQKGADHPLVLLVFHFYSSEIASDWSTLKCEVIAKFMVGKSSSELKPLSGSPSLCPLTKEIWFCYWDVLILMEELCTLYFIHMAHQSPTEPAQCETMKMQFCCTCHNMLGLSSPRGLKQQAKYSWREWAHSLVSTFHCQASLERGKLPA